MEGKRQFRAYCMMLPLMLILAGSVQLAAQDGTTSCDWKPGDLHKMHWPQVPDLGFTGVDVSLAQATLADDFRCSASGPIRDIHIWGSFLDDILPKQGPDGLTFELSIYEDVPAEKDRWSRPGKLRWTRIFKPDQYTVRRVHNGPEGWYDPVTGEYLPNNHRYAFQYNFCIQENPFVQEQGNVYWLAVRELSDFVNYSFGWKTTPPRYHWNDDAVYLDFANMDWVEMTYPKQHKYGERTLDLAFVITSGDETLPQADLGDAPDSSTSWPGLTMTAYPGVMAHFPTVYATGSPPYGPLHKRPRDMFYLGRWVSLENEADLGPDEDPTNNLVDALGVIHVASANATVLARAWPHRPADMDGADDGLQLPVAMPYCQETTLDYAITVTNAAPTEAYVNVWCDWNRNGSWDDLLTCPDGETIPEWAVQNDQPVLPGLGMHAFTTSPFKCWHPAGDETSPIWVRITISERMHLPSVLIPGTAPGIEGAGPADGYEYGETEDYYIRPEPEPTPVKNDWGDAPESAAAAGYPTLAPNGARHVVAGPWLGDDTDRPDSEPDGQPHPNALGDDNAGVDDENGVSIPPLVLGQLAVATMQVGGGGVVQAWIDFNADRTWQDSEQICNGFLPEGIHTISFTVPASGTIGQSFARFRISTRGGLEPGGPAADGEVEDHEVTIAARPNVKQWCQLPDVTPHGIDIRLDNSDEERRVLADDFECTSRGRLAHVRLWGSWKGDQKGEIKKIRLRIHPDDPVGAEGTDKKNRFSKPGPEVLWEGAVLAGQFQEKLYHVVRPGEWWWDTVTNEAKPDGDTEIWQIDIDIDPEDTFIQEGSLDAPRIYWLAVEVETADGQFGWKTRQWPKHFMDDAVWGSGPKVPQTWRELQYPSGHRYFDVERNSIDLAFCLRFASETPPPATMQPVSITRCPPEPTTCPALLTECPMMETRCPSEATQCPVHVTTCPAFTTRCPPAPTKCPALPTQCPVEETVCPLTETHCPVVQTKCPAGETHCPVRLTQCPPMNTRCPVAQTKCPPAQTKCPPTDTQCPLEETKCPPAQTKCPVVGTTCPGAVTKCPIAETQCPMAETKCPPIDTKCPIKETNCPPRSTHCPVYETRCPAVETKCPPDPTKCPPDPTKCPEDPTKCPSYNTKCPPTATLCQVIRTVCPIQTTVCPGEETRCPEDPTKCPPYETKCPATATLCRQIRTVCPDQPTMCPPVDTECPDEPTKCPLIETQCPMTATKCRNLVTLCPVIETQCPVGDVTCPPVGVTIPPPSEATREELVYAAHCPVVESTCPTVIDDLVVTAAR